MRKHSSTSPVTIDGKHYISTKEMAEVLGLSEVRVRTMAAKGDIPGVKLSRDWMFNPIDVKVAREEMQLHKTRSMPGPNFRKAYHPNVRDLF